MSFMPLRRSIQRARRRGYERRSSFERLEHRHLMAAGASLFNGVLTISSDEAGDDLAILGTGNPGELQVTGRNGTTLNGVANATVTFFPVTADLIVQMAGGDDFLSVDNAYIAGSITILTGPGDDTIHLAANHPVSPAVDLVIGAGSGNDLVTQQNYGVFVGRDNVINTVSGDDDVRLEGASAAGRIIVQGVEGNDSLLGVGLTSVGTMVFSGGSGANSIAVLFSAAQALQASSFSNVDNVGEAVNNNIYLDTNFVQTEIRVSGGNAIVGFPTTSITINQSIATAMFIEGGYGVNQVTIYGNRIDGPAYELGPAGSPPITPRIQYVGHSFGTPGSPDAIEMSYNITEMVSIATSGGDDSLSLIGNFFSVSTSLDGGEGQNFWSELGNVFGKLTVSNFV
jgi:hypothetical protein